MISHIADKAFYGGNRFMTNYLYSYLNTAASLVRAYEGKLPFSVFIKDFFKQHKKYGSADRRHISHLCYCFFRLGKAFQYSRTVEERLLVGQFLCSTASNIFLEALQPEWNNSVDLALPQKLQLLQSEDQAAMVFPLIAEISPAIDKDDFIASLFIQPDLFLRIRPGYKKKVTAALTAASVPFRLPADCAIGLSNSLKIEEFVSMDKEAVVQDLSSQQVLDTLLRQTDTGAPLAVWDCCAASGGKSILLKDKYLQARLTVSDIRESILINLKKRFSKAGIGQYTAFTADVSTDGFSIGQKFDLVICDAPCSGSGTWGRTPEWLSFFKEEKIDEYAALQKRLAANAAKAVKYSGYLLYITCSVFTKENEEVVKSIEANTALQLTEVKYYKGYGNKADTLFTALFQNK